MGADLAIELAVGCGVGFSIGLTGVGGGVLAMPALSVILGLPATTAVGTAGAYAFLTQLSACFMHWRLGTVDLAIARLLLLGGVPGGILACLGVGQLKARALGPEALLLFQSRLTTFIAGVMAFAVILLIANLSRERPEGPAEAKTVDPPPTGLRRIACISLGALVGAIIGATSVGGGVILVPVLLLVFGLDARRTVGTALAIALVLSLVTAVFSAGRGDVDWRIALLMAAGSLAGVFLGSRLAMRLPERLLQGTVVALLLIAIGAMLAKAG